MRNQQDTFLGSEMLRNFDSNISGWTPNIRDKSTKNEIFTTLDDASGASFATQLSQFCGADRSWMWVQDKNSRRLSGSPYLLGLPQSMQRNLHYIHAESCEDALFALEEGLRCSELSFVIGEISGNPKALTFTASRRLAVASETFGVPLYLLRGNAERQLSAARMRWQIQAAPSVPQLLDRKAPGAPRYQAELFRSRLHRPGSWTLINEAGKLAIAPDNLDLASQSRNQQMAATGR